ncbi:MAG TPA: PHP domain-containing protein [Anaerolineae bacterium]|nr:PHP domain-containing protein [Anaerolineae bacterium]
MIRIDLHVHTRYSGDCLTSFQAIIEACRRRGLGGVAITDHNRLEGALAFREVAPFPVIVGEEVDTSEGEIIGLFLKEEIPRGLTPEETVTRIKEQGGLVYIPHPMDRVRRSALRRGALERILDQVDAIEVFNARVTFPADNEEARRYAQEHGLPQGAGSDAHTPGEIGRAYVEMEPFNDPEEFLRHLAQGRVVGRLSSPLVHLASTRAKLYRRLRG